MISNGSTFRCFRKGSPPSEACLLVFDFLLLERSLDLLTTDGEAISGRSKPLLPTLDAFAPVNILFSLLKRACECQKFLTRARGWT